MALTTLEKNVPVAADDAFLTTCNTGAEVKAVYDIEEQIQMHQKYLMSFDGKLNSMSLKDIFKELVENLENSKNIKPTEDIEDIEDIECFRNLIGYQYSYLIYPENNGDIKPGEYCCMNASGQCNTYYYHTFTEKHVLIRIDKINNKFHTEYYEQKPTPFDNRC